MTLWLAVALACAEPGSPQTGSPQAGSPQTAPPEAALPPYTLELPGVIPADFYASVRADPALGAALDGQMLPALATGAPPSDRVAAFVAAREAALAARAARPVPAGPPRVPTAEELAAGPIGPMKRQDPVLVAFDRVCTDALRTWFRTYAAHLGRLPAPLEERLERLEALRVAAKTAFPWAPGEGESAAVEVLLEGAAAKERE